MKFSFACLEIGQNFQFLPTPLSGIGLGYCCLELGQHITEIFVFSCILPVELGKQVLVTNISEQLYHLQIEQNKYQSQDHVRPVYKSRSINVVDLLKPHVSNSYKYIYVADLFKSFFNCFITQFFTSSFLKNVITKSGKKFCTRVSSNTFVAKDLKSLFKSLYDQIFQIYTHINLT